MLSVAVAKVAYSTETFPATKELLPLPQKESSLALEKYFSLVAINH